MKIIFCCQSVDQKDPITGDTLDRIQGLLKTGKFEHIFVLTSRGSVPASSDQLSFYSLARHKKSRLRSFFNFVKILNDILNSHRISFFYAYMVPTMAYALYPLSIVHAVPIYVWFAHSKFTMKVKLSLNFLTKKWMTVDLGQSFQSRCPRYILGQGVDISAFTKTILDKDKKFDLITIGRITKVKNIELIFEAIHQLKTIYGKELSLSLCGEAYSAEDQSYKRDLVAIADRLGISNLIHFQGMISRKDLPQFINQARVFVFTVRGGIGKASLEAFACGLPSIISSPEAKDFSLRN